MISFRRSGSGLCFERPIVLAAGACRIPTPIVTHLLAQRISPASCSGASCDAGGLSDLGAQFEPHEVPLWKQEISGWRQHRKEVRD